MQLSIFLFVYGRKCRRGDVGRDPMRQSIPIVFGVVPMPVTHWRRREIIPNVGWQMLLGFRVEESDMNLSDVNLSLEYIGPCEIIWTSPGLVDTAG